MRLTQYRAYVEATGAVDHNDGNGLTLTPAQFALLQPMHFSMPSYTAILVPDAQIYPRKSPQDPIRSVFVMTDVRSFDIWSNNKLTPTLALWG